MVYFSGCMTRWPVAQRGSVDQLSVFMRQDAPGQMSVHQMSGYYTPDVRAPNVRLLHARCPEQCPTHQMSQDVLQSCLIDVIQATCLQWLDRIFTWTLQATSTWQNRIKSNHCILFQINRMFHFCVCVLFKFDGQNSNLKRTNKQSLLKDFFWGFLKRNIFWISLRLF